MDRAWDMTKKHLLPLLAFTGAVLGISTLMGLVPGAGQVVANLLSGVFYAGFFGAARAMHKGQAPVPADFKIGLSHIGPLITLTLIQILLYAIVLVPVIYSAYNDGILEVLVDGGADIDGFSSTTGTVLLLSILPLGYLTASYMWAVPFVIFYDLKPWAAMEASRRLIGARFWPMAQILLSFIGMFFMGVVAVGLLTALFPGFVLLVVPLIMFAMPFFYTAIYMAFATATSALAGEDSAEEHDIIDHLIE